MTIGGISAAELLAIPQYLRQCNVAALDFVEVNPQLDTSGQTAHIAARFLYEYLLLESVPPRSDQ